MWGVTWERGLLLCFSQCLYISMLSNWETHIVCPPLWSRLYLISTNGWYQTFYRFMVPSGWIPLTLWWSPDFSEGQKSLSAFVYVQTWLAPSGLLPLTPLSHLAGSPLLPGPTDKKKMVILGFSSRIFIGLCTDVCALSWIGKFLKALSCLGVVDPGKGICCLAHSVSCHCNTWSLLTLCCL